MSDCPVWLAFFSGIFLGVFVGFFVLALMVRARDADERNGA